MRSLPVPAFLRIRSEGEVAKQMFTTRKEQGAHITLPLPLLRVVRRASPTPHRRGVRPRRANCQLHLNI